MVTVMVRAWINIYIRHAENMELYYRIFTIPKVNILKYHCNVASVILDDN